MISISLDGVMNFFSSSLQWRKSRLCVRVCCECMCEHDRFRGGEYVTSCENCSSYSQHLKSLLNQSQCFTKELRMEYISEGRATKQRATIDKTIFTVVLGFHRVYEQRNNEAYNHVGCCVTSVHTTLWEVRESELKWRVSALGGRNISQYRRK